MRFKKAKKLLLLVSLVPSLSGCSSLAKLFPNIFGPKEPEKPSDKEETILVVDSLKNGFLALNSTKNYTVTITGQRIAENKRVYTPNSIGIIYKDNPSYDKIFYQDGDEGVYSIGFNGKKYVGSAYYNDISKDVWSGKFFQTMFGVETDYVKSISDSATTFNVKSKAYRTAFIKTLGYSAMDYVDLDSLVASFENGKFSMSMRFKNTDINLEFSNFGTSKDEVLDTFIENGGAPYHLVSNHYNIKSKMMLNNYEQYIFQFGETVETTGYIGKNYFHPNYFYTNYTGSLLASGHVALDGRESVSGEYSEIYGCYQFLLNYNDDAEQVLTLYPYVMYNEPDIPTFYNYPSKLSLWDHMEYLCEWDENVFDPQYDYELQGKGYTIYDPNLVYEIQNNFGIPSSFDGAVPMAVGIDYFSSVGIDGADYYIVFLCKFSYGGYTYTMPFPFSNFGNVKDAFLDAAIVQMKL